LLPVIFWQIEALFSMVATFAECGGSVAIAEISNEKMPNRSGAKKSRNKTERLRHNSSEGARMNSKQPPRYNLGRGKTMMAQKNAAQRAL